MIPWLFTDRFLVWIELMIWPRPWPCVEQVPLFDRHYRIMSKYLRVPICQPQRAPVLRCWVPVVISDHWNDALWGVKQRVFFLANSPTLRFIPNVKYCNTVTPAISAHSLLKWLHMSTAMSRQLDVLFNRFSGSQQQQQQTPKLWISVSTTKSQ